MATWRKLPSAPYQLLSAGTAIITSHLNGVFNMFLYKTHAYLFVGCQDMLKFDLEAEVWSVVRTTCKTKWPYCSFIRRASAAIYKNTVYLFGGCTLEQELGNNLLLKLDLDSMTWIHLTGTALPHARYGIEPSLRTGQSFAEHCHVI